MLELCDDINDYAMLLCIGFSALQQEQLHALLSTHDLKHSDSLSSQMSTGAFKRLIAARVCAL